MKWTVGRKIGSGFALALGILAIIGSVAYRGTVAQTDTAALVTRAHEVLEKLESVMRGVTDAETGERGFIITGDVAYLAPFQDAQLTVRQDLEALRGLVRDAGQQQRLARLEPLISGPEGKLALSQARIDVRRDPTKGFESARQLVLANKGIAVMTEIRRIVAEIETEQRSILTTRSSAALASARNTKLTIVIGTLIAALAVGLAGVLITRDIAVPLAAVSATAERIAEGDLSVSMAATDRQDEVGVLVRTFSRMTDSLNATSSAAAKIAAGDLRVKVQPRSEKDVLGNAFASMVGSLQRLTSDITEGANVLGASASEIVAATSQLAASATESAVAVSQTTTTVEEVRQTAEVASDKARALSDSAQKATQSAASGRKSTDDVATGMQRIRQQMDAIALSMGRLGEQSQAIAQIVATVEDLATQSNLLAVNAAIKAAEAGEHGKGFGVVALEVRSLAEQSRQATSQVRTLLGEIQKATSAAVLATEQGSKAVDGGSQQTEVAAESIKALAANVSEAALAATQIAASSRQQLVGVDQVVTAMQNIKQASSQNVGSAQQMEVAARNLNELGQRLKQMVQRYTLEPGTTG